MTCRISAFLCGLAMLLAAGAAHARADAEPQDAWMWFEPLGSIQIDWGGATSRGNIKVTGLPQKSGPVMADVIVVKTMDAATPLLQRAFKSRTPLSRFVIKGRDAKGKYLTFRFKNAMVSKMETSQSGADMAVDTIAISYRTVEVEYK